MTFPDKTDKVMSLQAGGKLAYLHQFLKFSLDIIQSANVLPGDVGHLNHSLTQGWWVALAQGPLQINKKILS